MLQYIINASAIWLLSLVVYDLFLSRETFHSYNRTYLLGTFALGLVLPLWQWPQEAAVASTTSIVHVSTPVLQRVAAVKTGIVSSKTTSAVLDMQTILWWIYLTGVFVLALYTIKELITIWLAYKQGRKYKDGVWTIVETGKQHSPYSAFRVVFISSKEDYAPQQLQFILTHEQQHGHLLHFFDLLVMQVAKITLWLHPLVYVYADRLNIVHEFQADAAVDKNPKEYGEFLIEQSILGAAPTLSHSFNSSPIKKRILMLTSQSSSLAKSKTLIVLPLLAVCMLCCTKNSITDNQRVINGNTVTYRGNVITLGSYTPDTLTITTGESQEASQVVFLTDKDRKRPMTLNGEKIYDSREMSQHRPAPNTSNYMALVSYEELNVYLLENMKEDLQSLKDGCYTFILNDVVINTEGKIVYYTTAGVATCADNKNKVAASMQDQLTKKISKLLDDAPAHAAAMMDDKHVNFLLEDHTFPGFMIRDGKVVTIYN